MYSSEEVFCLDKIQQLQNTERLYLIFRFCTTYGVYRIIVVETKLILIKLHSKYLILRSIYLELQWVITSFLGISNTGSRPRFWKVGGWCKCHHRIPSDDLSEISDWVLLRGGVSQIRATVGFLEPSSCVLSCKYKTNVPALLPLFTLSC